MSEHDWRLSVMPPHDTIAQIPTVWKACEDAGLDVVGPADSQNLMREMVVSLTVAAMSTSKIKLMTYATNPVTRHPTVTAAAFVALEELAPGRLMMGIATGDSALWSMGRKPARLARLRDYLVTVKALCAGEEVRWGGHAVKPRWAGFEPFDLPTYVMCSGPKTLRMAAEAADGAVVHMGFAAQDLDEVEAIVDAGRRAAGKEPRGFDLWWNAPVVFDESYAAAAARNLGWMPQWLTMGSMEGKGIPADIRDKVRELNADTHHLDTAYLMRDREKKMVERAKRLGIYDWLMSRSARLMGSDAEIADRFKRARSQPRHDAVDRVPLRPRQRDRQQGRRRDHRPDQAVRPRSARPPAVAAGAARYGGAGRARPLSARGRANAAVDQRQAAAHQHRAEPDADLVALAEHDDAPDDPRHHRQVADLAPVDRAGAAHDLEEQRQGDGVDQRRRQHRARARARRRERIEAAVDHQHGRQQEDRGAQAQAGGGHQAGHFGRPRQCHVDVADRERGRPQQRQQEPAGHVARRQAEVGQHDRQHPGDPQRQPGEASAAKAVEADREGEQVGSWSGSSSSPG